MRLQGKIAVVTGGASGIGAATSTRFAREGAKIAVLDLQLEKAREVAAECGADTLALEADVCDEAAVMSAIKQVADRFGRIDVLINNAGIPGRQPIDQLDEPTWTRVLDVSLKGAFLCSKAALPFMEAGSIVHLSSVAGIVGMRNRPAYSAAKAGLVALAKNMALDYASRGIRVNCVCPGFTQTPLVAAIAKDPERWKRMESLHPLGRLGTTDDIANALLFLASDEASWITGTCLVVDGGFSAGPAADV
jgi:NAD(P)-dependent dehydrogenase (short-subunit alcohol dehydrogenase family)